MNENLIQGQVDLIREVFVYANRFKGKRFVIQIGSSVVEDPRFPTLVRDLAILHNIGINIILVPGAGRRIDEVLSRYGIQTHRAKGIRISNPEAMPLIKMAAFDVANMVMTQLASQQVDAVIGNWVKARSIGVRDGVDFLNAGTVARINTTLLNKVMAEGIVPILPCIGWSGSGTPYNISSLELASYIAEQVGAEKLFFIADGLELKADKYQVPDEGVVVRDGVVTRLSAVAADLFVERNSSQLLETGESWSSEGLAVELLRLAAHAARSRVERIHLVNGRIEGVILKEIFSTLGQGTMVHADPFDSIRPMRSGDIAEVLSIMEPNIQKGILVRRDEQDLLRLYKDFVVYETDGTIRGCAALHPYGGETAEIAGVAVDPAFSHLGLGQKLIRYQIDQAIRRGLSQVFLLTTQTGDYFESLGFAKGEPADLPPEKRAKYDVNRNSRVYVLNLDKMDREA